MSSKAEFDRIARAARLDLAARIELNRWLEQDQRALDELVAREWESQHGFELDSDDPYRVGMDAMSDRYTPEQLIAACRTSRGEVCRPRRVNWDRLQSC